MRLLFAVTHYYDAAGGGRHGSLGSDPAPRVAALRQLVLQLHRLFGSPAGVLNHLKRRVDQAHDGTGELTILICVSGEKHLLGQLDDLAGGFTAVACEPEDPKLLGFACHRELAARFGDYDYSCYLEDDILINDSDFFLKLAHFNRVFGNQLLLLPNRIETTQDLARLRRFYIDGDYNPDSTQTYRQLTGQRFSLDHLGTAVQFVQPLNPHAGCFFLNRQQAAAYFDSEASRAIDVSFHGPLESAATLGMLKTFQIVKPHYDSGRFLTVEHAGRNFMGLVR